MKKIILILAAGLLLTGCLATTQPNQVVNADTNSVITVQFGTILEVTPVTIKNDNSDIGAFVGVMVGSILGEEIGSGSGQVLGSIAGAVIGGLGGNAIEAKLGENNGFAYMIEIKNGTIISVVQALDKDGLNNYAVGEYVKVLQGNDQVRVLRSKVVK